jgi:hypothetical protein
MDNNYLMHYGVMGMKWGVRRYQNADGSRTSLGKKRERKEYRITKREGGHNISAKRLKKNMDNMSDQELRTALNRLNMQREVANANPSYIKRGENTVKRYTAILGTAVAAIAISQKTGIDKWVKDTLGWVLYRTIYKGI